MIVIDLLGLEDFKEAVKESIREGAELTVRVQKSFINSDNMGIRYSEAFVTSSFYVVNEGTDEIYVFEDHIGSINNLSSPKQSDRDEFGEKVDKAYNSTVKELSAVPGVVVKAGIIRTPKTIVSKNAKG